MSEHELWNELGNLYFMSGAYNQAAHAYERSIQSKTSFGRPYSNLALTYVQQGKYDEAIDLYRRSIELLTDENEKAISWNRLGSVYRHLKDYSKAVIAFQEADELDPSSADDFPAENPARHHAPSAPSSVLDESAVHVTETPAPQTSDEAVSEIVLPQACEAADEPIAEIIEQSAIQVAEEPIAEIAEESSVQVADEPIAEITEQSMVQVAVEPVTESVEELEVQVAGQPIAELIEPPAVLVTDEAIPEIVEEPVMQLLEETAASVDIAPISQLLEEPVAEQVELEVAQVLEEPVSDLTEPKLEWWDVDERRVQSATQSPEAIAAAAADPNTSWTPADLSQFQQDVSQMPQAGSLTVWRDADFEDDFELWSPFDPETDVQAPDPDGDNISRWLPMPEEEPLNLDELSVPPSAEELDAESEPPAEWNGPSTYQVVSNQELVPLSSTNLGVPASVDSIQNRQSSWEAPDVDIAVEERPAPDFAVASQDLSISTATETVACAAQADLVQASTSEVAPLPEPPVPDRDEEEMHEIEMGIAKFRRVVQLNPRNAHAWDALGTLFKSAGLYRDAIIAYQQAISNDPSKSLYYHHLGLVYACEGRDEDAIGAFQRVIEIDPEYSLAHATLGGYYRKLGLEELAQQHIGKAMKNIFDSENEYNRACLEAICGNADHAIELLNVALKNKQTYVDWILRDPDLDFIRQDPRFKQLISEYTR
jgi:tetratricopeptide (TPR) repeat protein